MNVKNVWLKKHLQGQSHKVTPVLLVAICGVVTVCYKCSLNMHTKCSFCLRLIMQIPCTTPHILYYMCLRWIYCTVNAVGCTGTWVSVRISLMPIFHTVVHVYTIRYVFSVLWVHGSLLTEGLRFGRPVVPGHA